MMPARDGAKEALFAAAGLLLLLTVGKPVSAAVGGLVGDVLNTLMAAFQLYVPLWLIQRAGETPESHAIHAHGLLLGPIAALRKKVIFARRRAGARRQNALTRALSHYGRGAALRPRDLLRDLGRAAFVAAVTFPPFSILHHLWQTKAPQLLGELGLRIAGAPLHSAYYSFHLPDDLFVFWMKNTFLIALPEEMFYRGFLETRLERLWPTRWHFLAIPISRTVVVSAVLFALGHFLGEWNPARLGPFFPAFLFSMLTRKSRSISGAVVYHGMSNAFSAFLYAGYR